MTLHCKLDTLTKLVKDGHTKEAHGTFRDIVMFASSDSKLMKDCIGELAKNIR